MEPVPRYYLSSPLCDPGHKIVEVTVPNTEDVGDDLSHFVRTGRRAGLAALATSEPSTQ